MAQKSKKKQFSSFSSSKGYPPLIFFIFLPFSSTDILKPTLGFKKRGVGLSVRGKLAEKRVKRGKNDFFSNLTVEPPDRPPMVYKAPWGIKWVIYE
jgi:hypothetical protein